MKNKLYIPTTVFVLIVIVWGSSYGTTSEAQDLNAPVSTHTSSAPKRWEHCSLSLVNGFVRDGKKVTGAATINYVRDTGYHAERVEATVEDQSGTEKAEETVMSKAVSKLGNEGWELVGEGTMLKTQNGGAKVLYFKREIK